MCFKRLFIFAFCLWFIGADTAHPFQSKLTLLTESNPPHTLLNASTGEIEGIAVDISKTLLAATNIEYTMHMLPWNRAYRRALSEVNTCVFPINHTAAREDLFQWISPTQTGGWAIFQSPNSTIELKTIEDIGKYALVGKIGSMATTEVEKIIGRKVLRTAGDEDSIQLLYRGRADLWVSGVNDAPAAAEKMNMPHPKMALNWKPATFGIACSKQTDPILVEKLIKANEVRLIALEKAKSASIYSQQ